MIVVKAERFPVELKRVGGTAEEAEDSLLDDTDICPSKAYRQLDRRTSMSALYSQVVLNSWRNLRTRTA